VEHLKKQAEDLAARESRLAADLEATRAEGQKLRAAIEVVERYIAEESEPGGAFHQEPLMPTFQGRRKIRSTERVGEIVSQADRPLRRAEILAAFHDRGLTETMQNPANAINTAILRAVERGLVRQVGIDEFASIPASQPEDAH